jgi:hypothetical protein
MTTVFNTNRDMGGNSAFAPAPSDVIYKGILSQGIAQSITLPSDASQYVVGFSFQDGSDVWVAYNHTADAPTGALALSNSERNPAQRLLPKGTVISLITQNTTADCCVVVYALNIINTMN